MCCVVCVVLCGVAMDVRPLRVPGARVCMAVSRRTAGMGAILWWTGTERAMAKPTGGPYYADGSRVGVGTVGREQGRTIPSIERIAMRKEMVKLVQEKVVEHVGPEARHPQLLRLAVADAATYQFGAKKNIGGPAGGANGSVVLSSEERQVLVREGLGEVIQQLEKAKEDVDREWKNRAEQRMAIQAPLDLSWADMIALAAQAGVMEAWNDPKEQDKSNAPFTSRQGRKDAQEPEPYQRMPNWVLSPKPDNATAARAWFRKNGFNDAQAGAVIAELCGGLADGMNTLQGDPKLAKMALAFQKDQAAYRQAFQEGFVRLTSLGSSFEPYAYLYDRQ